MSRPGKIDDQKLIKMLREGKSPGECAKYFDVSPAAISKKRKSIQIGATRNVTMRNAEKVVDQSINAIDQLCKINDNANELLDLLMRWNRGDAEALQVLESQVKRVRIGEGEEAEIQEIKFQDPRQLALKAMAEIRNQLKLMLDIQTMLYDAQAAKDFQDSVLEIIGEVAPDVRQRILDTLQKRRAIYRAVCPTG